MSKQWLMLTKVNHRQPLSHLFHEVPSVALFLGAVFMLVPGGSGCLFDLGQGINVLFLVGGDGTQLAGNLLFEEARKRNLKVSIVGIPKSIDNAGARMDAPRVSGAKFLAVST